MHIHLSVLEGMKVFLYVIIEHGHTIIEAITR